MSKLELGMTQKEIVENTNSIFDDVALLQEQMAAAQATIISLSASVDYTVLLENDDLNDLGVGHYIVPNYNVSLSLSNKPDSTGQTATIEVMSGGDTGQLVMLYQPCIKENAVRYVRTYYADGWGGWLKLNEFDNDSGWLNLTLNSGWTMNDYASEFPQYRKIGNMVYLRGLVNATAAAGVSIATLPIGFRPGVGSFNRFRCALNQIDSANVQVNTSTGAITDYTKGTSTRAFLCLNGISFLTD